VFVLKLQTAFILLSLSLLQIGASFLPCASTKHNVVDAKMN